MEQILVEDDALSAVYGTVVLYMTPPNCLKTNRELWSPNGVMNVGLLNKFLLVAFRFYQLAMGQV